MVSPGMADGSRIPVQGTGPGVSAWQGTARQGDPAAPIELLLVEDDPGDAFLVEELLSDADVRNRLTWVRTMAEARRELARGRFQCVLLDLHLADAQGLDALETLLAGSPDAAVIVLTGLAEAEAGLAAVAAGAQDYIAKGRLESEWLGRAIRYAVQRKQGAIAAAALQAGRLRAEENARLERGLLPSPKLATAEVVAVTRYRPGRAHSLLGGDFYDVVETPDGTVHAVIGDVAGHGPDEAALGVCLRVAWRSFVLAGVRGPRLPALLEELLLAERDDDECFVTLTTLRLRPDRRTVDVLRAGHPAMLLRGPGPDVRLVETAGGMALGLLPGFGDWPEERVELPPGAELVLFTDGLFEGETGPGGRRLDLDGLLGLAERGAGLDASDFVDALIMGAELASADYGGLGDDVAVVALGWKGT
ncbi:MULTISPECIES: PP2C family protein-serine/threonine phosphatase [Actinomadura]|uniref:PP2C family protein-serine/threonine phosphatase n=1 Tax=Actinomadura yumaensis TaxID=111807 RepID=A0ABW2CNQ0_9ACTN|nr:fused response regulator/phosphatase [Actinomadura sp. J1-007]